MFNYFDYLNEVHRQQEAEYDRLRAEMPKVLNVGDKVLLALGLLGYGFLWIREEGEVLDVRDSSVKVKFQPRYSHDCEEERWIDRALVTDIIERAKETDVKEEK